MPVFGPSIQALESSEEGDYLSVFWNSGLSGIDLGLGTCAGKTIAKLLKKGEGGGRVRASFGDVTKTPHQVLPNTEAFLKSAEAVWKQGAQGTLNVAGRALQKHAGRAGSAFSNIKFSGKTANQDARKVIERIMNSKDQFIKVKPNGTTTIYDKVSKRGFNISRKGLFNGFRTMD